MKIQVKRSGGVAGILPPPVTVDSNDLSAAEAKKLHELVVAADFFNLPTKSSTPPSGPDRYLYTIVVDTGDRTHKVQVSEDQMPDGLRALLNWLPRPGRAPGEHP